MTFSSELLRNWVPAHIYWQEETPYADWYYMGNDRFVRPFFEDTITVRRSDPFSLLFRHRTPLHFLKELYERGPGITPTGFIFHMSRCGSTLVSQMLAALPENIVLSEAPPLDSVLRCDASVDERAEYLKWTVSALGQKRFDEEKHLFIKFDSWSALNMDVVKKAFPDVPWIFLYRNPVEVIVSQIRQRGAQMVPGSLSHLLPEMSFEQVLRMPAEDYCAQVLAKVCASILPHLTDPKGIAINYQELPGAVTGTILEHFNISYSDAAIEKMKEAAKFDAKTPRLTFTSDSSDKREAAGEVTRAAAAKWLDTLYDELEAVRANRADRGKI